MVALLALTFLLLFIGISLMGFGFWCRDGRAAEFGVCFTAMGGMLTLILLLCLLAKTQQ